MRLIVLTLLIFSVFLTACAGDAEITEVNEESPPTEAAPTEETVAEENTGGAPEQMAGVAALPTESTQPTATAPPSATPFPTASAVPPLGDLRQESDVVEFGVDETTLSPISDIVPFYNGNLFRARDGGEGLLNFSTGLVLRLFNNTQVSSLRVDNSTPRQMRMFVQDGGFTGNFKPLNPGELLAFDVPGGAQITILGTRFFVVYDPEKERSTIANFDGAVQIDVDGIPTDLQPGYYTRIPDDEQPGPQRPIPESSDPFGDFEGMARELLSPIAAADQYPELEFEDVVVIPTATRRPVQKTAQKYDISIDYFHGEPQVCSAGCNAIGEMTGSVTWQGQLDVSNGLVSGSGTASFEGGGRCGGGTLYTYTGKVPVTFEGRFFGDRFSGFSINGPNRDEAFAQTNFSFPEGGQCSLDELAGYGIPAAYDAGIANSKFLSLSVGYQVPFVWEPEGSTFRQKLEVTITEEK